MIQKYFILLTAVAMTFSLSLQKTGNITGYADDSHGHVVSGPTEETGCGLNLDIDCSITVAGVNYQPIYNSAANVGNAADILMYSE